jgi:hypothetical protein
MVFIWKTVWLPYLYSMPLFPSRQHIVSAKADRLKPVVLTLGWKINPGCTPWRRYIDGLMFNLLPFGHLEIGILTILYLPEVLHDIQCGPAQTLLESSMGY